MRTSIAFPKTNQGCMGSSGSSSSPLLRNIYTDFHSGQATASTTLYDIPCSLCLISCFFSCNSSSDWAELEYQRSHDLHFLITKILKLFPSFVGCWLLFSPTRRDLCPRQLPIKSIAGMVNMLQRGKRS